jgi:hypothetical protein
MDIWEGMKGAAKQNTRIRNQCLKQQLHLGNKKMLHMRNINDTLQQIIELETIKQIVPSSVWIRKNEC